MCTVVCRGHEPPSRPPSAPPKRSATLPVNGIAWPQSKEILIKPALRQDWSRGSQRCRCLGGGPGARCRWCPSPRSCRQGGSPVGVFADEHLSPGEHRHAELCAPAPLHQNLPGAPRPAGLAGLSQRPQAGTAHLDLQPKRHPHGSRRQGASLYGLG